MTEVNQTTINQCLLALAPTFSLGGDKQADTATALLLIDLLTLAEAQESFEIANREIILLYGQLSATTKRNYQDFLTEPDPQKRVEKTRDQIKGQDRLVYAEKDADLAQLDKLVKLIATTNQTAGSKATKLRSTIIKQAYTSQPASLSPRQKIVNTIKVILQQSQLTKLDLPKLQAFKTQPATAKTAVAKSLTATCQAALDKSKDKKDQAWYEDFTIKPKLAVRVRSQADYPVKGQDAGQEVERWRPRWSLTADAELWYQKYLGLGFGLRSGTAHDSYNVTFTDTPEVSLHQAFLAGQLAVGGFSLEAKAGLMPHPFWRPGKSDALWDHDITPALVYAKLGYNFSSGAIFFGTIWQPLDEIKADESDPYLAAFQPGFSWSPTSWLTINAAAIVQITQNIQGNNLPNSRGTNRQDENGKRLDDYDSVSPQLEIAFKPNKNWAIITYGEYAYNWQAEEDNQAFATGLAISGKISNWKLGFDGNYRWLQQNSVLDSFPDSDSVSGKTGIYGPEFKLALAWRFLSLSVTYHLKGPVDDWQEKKPIPCKLTLRAV